MGNNKNESKKQVTADAAQRGKKAIDAGKKAMGKNPSDADTKNKEKKDAEQWRNEG